MLDQLSVIKPIIDMTDLKVLIGLGVLLVYLGGAKAKPRDFDLVAEESKIYKEGGGKAFDAAQRSAQGEVGKKGYSAQHAKEKGEIGHHDQERHQKEYTEEGGNKKGHHHDDGYYASDYKGSQGEKGYHFVDKGSYAKGHDTKGHHNIHKLDEFQKKKEFFDEDHDEAHKEKHGAFDVGKSFKNGEFKKGGHAKKGFFEGEFGSSGKSEKGGHNFEKGGFKKAAGGDQYFKDAEEFAKKGGAEGFKEFGFSEKH